MSTAETGDAKLAADVVADAKALLAAAQAEEEQLALLEPPTAEEMVEAREALGPSAGRMAVVVEARKRRGRKPGSRNRRTDDFARYLMGFGQHPAITMMQIQATAPELLIEASQQEKVHSFNKFGQPNVVVERMTFSDAQSLRIRCAEALLPYLESKKPVAVDLHATGDFNLIVPGMNVSEDDAQALIEGEFVEIGAWEGGDAAQ